MSAPVAVLISDIHYDLNTLIVADTALRQAIDKANALQVPLIVAGDLHNTKANLRGECVNTMLDTFELCHKRPYVIVGNHCRINERSTEHSLTFLKHACNIINRPAYVSGVESWLIPYYSNPDDLQSVLNDIDKPARLIMHQGVLDSNSGHYIQDKSALPKASFADFRVISGHYHRAQDMECGPSKPHHVGIFSYIGNPYTLNFSEAADPEKGFAVLYSDGSLRRIPTDLRRHVVVEYAAKDAAKRWNQMVFDEDLLWLKITGTRSELAALTKASVAEAIGRADFKLDLIPTDASATEAKTEKMTGAEIMDALIDQEPDSADERAYLKQLWRSLT